MSKKLIIQIFLISLTLILSTIFFYEITKKEKNISSTPKTIIKDTETSLIEGIQYFSKDVKGNTYLIESKSGSLDEENPDIIYLVDVEAKINFDKNNEIKVTSDEAIYNINNFDTEFINNVKLFYEDNKITCRNILVKFSKNYAILSGDLVYNNLLTKLIADRMEVDLLSRTKTSMMNENDKIKIIHKNNGIN